MKGNSKVIDGLNDSLTKALTAINQTFLHARMLQDWGMEKIGELEYKVSIKRMKHADSLIKRVLFLEGLPNVQKMERILIGQDIREILAADLKMELENISSLKDCVSTSEEQKDYVSMELLEDLLESAEDHVDWLETQLGLLDKTGTQNYIQSQIEMKTE